MTSRFGNEVTPVRQVCDTDGNVLGCWALMDGRERFYRLIDLRATDGIGQIVHELAGLPVDETEDAAS